MESLKVWSEGGVTKSTIKHQLELIEIRGKDAQINCLIGKLTPGTLLLHLSLGFFTKLV